MYVAGQTIDGTDGTGQAETQGKGERTKVMERWSGYEVAVHGSECVDMPHKKGIGGRELRECGQIREMKSPTRNATRAITDILAVYTMEKSTFDLVLVLSF